MIFNASSQHFCAVVTTEITWSWCDGVFEIYVVILRIWLYVRLQYVLRIFSYPGRKRQFSSILLFILYGFYKIYTVVVCSMVSPTYLMNYTCHKIGAQIGANKCSKRLSSSKRKMT